MNPRPWNNGMSNRVEELESTVQELKAAVDGLTEELVETRERLRQLENAASTEVDPDDSDGNARRRVADDDADLVDAEADAADSAPDRGPASDADADPADEATEGDGADDETDGSGDDTEIIVA